jgi:hypothetical protein
MTRKPTSVSAHRKDSCTLSQTDAIFICSASNLIPAQHVHGLCDKRDESRDMPKDQCNRGTNDISTPDSKFRTSVKHPDPQETIQQHQQQRDEINDIEDFEK